MYSANNEGKPVVAEIFIRILKNKIYKHMRTVSKNVYFDESNNIVDKYNNTYHNTIKMKPIDVKCNSYAKYSVDPNAKYPKFKIRDHVRISMYKITFAKGFIPNWLEEVFLISKIKNNVSWTYVIMDLNSEEILEIFMKKNRKKKQIKKNSK